MKAIANFMAKCMGGTRNDRILKKFTKDVNKINALSDSYASKTDDQLRETTVLLRERLAAGESLDDLLPDAFAATREAASRHLNMRHFDVQLMGGIALHRGDIAEMHTGEGKTLTATLAAYLNSIPEKGVHIVTVNDYLAKRDANWMRPVFEALGLSVAFIKSGMAPSEKKAAYNSDITYGTNNEFGFDYLRDNMAFSLDEKMQRDLNYAIVDEVDSILIDEARTPLIISGPAEDSSELYKKIDKAIPLLKRQHKENKAEEPLAEDEIGDYFLDEKSRQAYFTEEGLDKIEKWCIEQGLLEVDDNLYHSSNLMLLHHLNAALRAYSLFKKNVDYIVQDGKIVIVDEHTGRTMPGRRWSDGLHQAVEAKENLKINQENQTLASVTFQNYFRLYNKLSGMTGTADTEAHEFHQIYNLEVIILPTNRVNKRKDEKDLVYYNVDFKFKAIIEDIENCVKNKRPVLVGTASIENSEKLSKALTAAKIEHKVLNAKFHEKEAEIIAEAGRPGAVTLATNMAGRGTDIVLGGSLKVELAQLAESKQEELTEAEIEKATQDWQIRHDEVVAAGGLHVIGSERHESRRIDNQLRGRCGRQGDPGSTRFYLALDDPLMRIFASPRMVQLMGRVGMDDGLPIESGMVTRAVENAQRKIEGRNFDIRKQLLQFDNVANDQRRAIYTQRAELMASEDVSDNITSLRETVVEALIDEHMPPNSMEEQWTLAALEEKLEKEFDYKVSISSWLDDSEQHDPEDIKELLLNELLSSYKEKEEQAGSALMRRFEKAIMLQRLDLFWKDHLAQMDHLRQGINLRGYAQKDPKNEYKREAFNLFQMMLAHLKQDIVAQLTRFKVAQKEDVEALEEKRRQQALKLKDAQFKHMAASGLADAKESAPAAPGANNASASPAQPAAAQPFVRNGPKIGRNDPCYCGSGKKYKHCHGKIES